MSVPEGTHRTALRKALPVRLYFIFWVHLFDNSIPWLGGASQADSTYAIDADSAFATILKRQGNIRRLLTPLPLTTAAAKAVLMYKLHAFQPENQCPFCTQRHAENARRLPNAIAPKASIPVVKRPKTDTQLCICNHASTSTIAAASQIKSHHIPDSLT